MIKIGITIVYGTQICKITDKTDRTFGKITRNYYVLTPVFDNKNVIYVPSDNEMLVSKMRRVLSVQEIYSLIEAIPNFEITWIEDDKSRAQKYKEIIESGDCERIIKIIKTLFEHKCLLEEKGKKLRAADETILALAEKVLYEEFALVLDIKKEEVIPFITKQIEINQKK